MSALPYQPVPTLAQRRELSRDHAKRHPIRQYSEVQAMAVQPEPAQFCAVADEESSVTMLTVLGWCLAGLGTWAAVGYATWWVAGLVFGARA